MSFVITKNHKWVILAILNLTSSICLVSLALLSKYILDAAQNKDTTSVLMYSGILLGLVAAGIIFKFIENILHGKFFIEREMELKHLLLEKRISMSFENKNFHTAILLQNYTTDISNIVSGEMDIYPTIFYQMGRFIFALILVAILDWKVLLILLGVGFIGLVFARIYSLKMKKLHQDVLLKDGVMNAFFQESIENVTLVEAYSAQKSFLNHYDQKASAATTARKKKYHLQIAVSSAMVLVSNLLYGFCIAYGGYAIAMSWITYGSLLALSQLIQHLQTPILSISGWINRYSLAKTSYQRFANSLTGSFLEEQPIEDFTAISAKNLSFGYPEHSLVFNDVSFEIHKGDIVRIVGESGIGKTTLMMLLMGFLTPVNGSIEVLNDREKIKGSLHSLFAYVPQDNILFSSTVRENFELLATTDEHKMEEALAFACLDNEIPSLDLVLNERGKGLSIGQIQRLAIAIAFAKDRPIFLLDEFTSALDEQNAKEIIKHLRQTNKTIIFVSHKDESMDVNVTIDLSKKRI